MNLIFEGLEVETPANL